MIPHGVEIFVSVESIDLRWGFDRLSGIVTERMARPPKSGALFVFFGKRRDALKILFADNTGLILFYKRLFRGTFRLPPIHEAGATSIALDERALDDLLDGIDIETETKALRRRKPRVH